MDNKYDLIARLERENSYLKSLLKQNGISYEEPKEIKQHNFSDGEKINLYLSYFVGRDDIFAYEYKIFTKSNNTIEHKNVCGLYKTNLEINAVIIDQKILWYGGINPFKTVTYNDSIMRINDKSICETILKEAKKIND